MPTTSEARQSQQRSQRENSATAQKALALLRGRSQAPVEGIGRRATFAGTRLQPEPDSGRAALVASLRQSLAEKESALQRASLTAFQLRKQLDLAGKENESLQKQAEAATQKNPAIESRGLTAEAAPRRRIPRAAGRPGLRLPESALAELARDRSREIRTRLVAGAVPAAVVAVVWGIWSQMPHREFFRHAQPVPVAAEMRTGPLRETPDAGNAPGKSDSRLNTRFNQALSRLNGVLMYSPGSAQQLLNAARERESARHRDVCDFSWNGGQPALRYHEGRLIYMQLDECASAVESYIYGQKEAPTANDRGW